VTITQEGVSRILSVLSHPLRREILSNLSQKGECSFTELMNALNIDTGKLSFHIRSLNGFLEQTPTGKYKLNKIGENGVKLLEDVEVWASEVHIAKKASAFPFASFGRRVLAFLIDFFLLLTITILATLPQTIALSVNYILGGTPPRIDLNTIVIVTFVLLWLYSTLLEGFEGQSLGKRLVGLKVIRLDGKKLSFDYAAVRNFGKVFLLPFDLLIGHRLKDERFTRYFDKFTGTTVIDLRL